MYNVNVQKASKLEIWPVTEWETQENNFHLRIHIYKAAKLKQVWLVKAEVITH